jgi:D-alanyl-D-alanine carboxypeptidase
MTATIALERLRLRQIVRVPEEATRAAPNREGLRKGERVRAWKLLDGLLLYSGNDDAVALAIASAGSRGRFIDEMNTKARELGMTGTRFSTPSGVVDRGNYSTAWDMAALARYALRNPRFAKVVATRRVGVKWSPPTYAKTYVNKNQLLGTYRGADGVKTGWTTLARHCLVASAHRGKVRLIAVVLHSEDPFGDARRLLNLGFRVRG